MNPAYSKHTLANGLDVIIHEDHGCPIAAVNVWYHVGSKNERPGLTGLAHLFEHLMFEGSAHHDRSYFEPLQQAGGLLNGSTNTDRTNYWDLVPINALELALWLESDRMGYLSPALSASKFETQLGVVLNERRQTYENRPYGLAGMALVAALFPPEHPYHWTTIGRADDLRRVTLDDARQFLQHYYHPGNASLVVAGDVDTTTTLRLVRRYFEDLPTGPPVAPLTVAPSDGEFAGARLVLQDRVELPRLYLAWHSPAMFASGDADLDLAADILANGKTSRLYRTLVYEQRLAVDVSAGQGFRELTGLFQLVVTATPGRALGEVEKVVRLEIARLASEGPSRDEMERARVQTEADFIYRLQSVGGFNGISDRLNGYNVFRNEPGYFTQDLDRYRSATRESVARAVGRYLDDCRSVALSVVPEGRPDLALADSSVAEVA